MTQTLNKNPRIEVVDALRGFAVMAILLVHNLEHFIFPVYPTDSPSWLNCFRPRGVQQRFHTLCRKGIRYFRPSIRLYFLYSDE